MYGLDLFYGVAAFGGSHPPSWEGFSDGEAEAARSLVRGVGAPHVPRHGDEAAFFYGLRAAAARGDGRGLQFSTSHLNLSRVCH